MLNHIYIKNFVFIDTLELALTKGVIMITGETGAGKSIILGAIDAALGQQRNLADKIKYGEHEAEIVLSFDVSNNQRAKNFLEAHALNDSEDTCIIRRVIYQDGKTRNFINGRPSNITTLKECGELLLTLHTQHENQLLLSSQGQTELVDAYAGNEILLKNIEKTVGQWKKIDSEIKNLSEQAGDKNQRLDYLSYQQQELANAHLNLEEIIDLPKQHKLLISSREIIECYENILSSFSPNDSIGIVDMLHRLRQPIATAEKLSANNELSSLLNNAIIQLEELRDTTQYNLNKIEIYPEKLQEIEARMSELHQLARKHHITPEELPALLEKIDNEIENIRASDKKIITLKQQQQDVAQEYMQLAEQLTNKRAKSIETLAKKITQIIHSLGMPTAEFSIALNKRTPTNISKEGAEQAEFLLKANSGHPATTLKKSVSGGELARVSLALQATLASYIQIPTLILDEIDVGVGGKVAAMIGEQLRALGETHQVICITHQAQIAASAKQHFNVTKKDLKNKTTVTVSELIAEQRVEEIARMLGGLSITEHALQHAREMLA